MRLDVLNRGLGRVSDTTRPHYLTAVTAVSEGQASSEVPTIPKTPVESVRRPINPRADRASGGRNNSEGSIQGSPPASKRQAASTTSTTPPLEQRPDSSLRYRRYINHLLTYLLNARSYREREGDPSQGQRLGAAFELSEADISRNNSSL